MRDLTGTLSHAFHCLSYNTYGYGIQELDKKSRYMIIPINKGHLEVPMFAMYAFNHTCLSKEEGFDALAIQINYVGVNTTYKSLDAGLRDTLGGGFSATRLERLPTIANSEKVYYATHGAIFDDKFNPIMILTWEMRKTTDDENFPLDYAYSFVCPILRVAPEVVIDKSNALERYIVNKIIPASLSLYDVYKPTIPDNQHFRKSNDDYCDNFKVRVIIEKIPFMIKDIDKPSISTTNKALIDVALDHIGEIGQ